MHFVCQHIKRLIFVLSCIGASVGYSFSQSAGFKDKLFIEGSYHYGYIMPHHEFMAYFINKHVQGFQLNLGIQTDGSRLWHKHYNFPKMGVGFFRSGLGNDAIYGHMNAVYFFFDRMFLNNNRTINFGNKIAFGLSYLDKRYDMYTNPFNIAIGSRLNVYINYRIETDIRLNPLLHFKAGLGVTHASNGHFKEPNKGVNVITTNASLIYSFSDLRKTIASTTQTEPENAAKNQYLITAAYGWKGTSRLVKNEYPVYALSIEYARKVSRTSALGSAITFYVDKSLRNALENDFENPGATSKPADNLRIAFNLSYEMRMGNLAYLIQPGIYLKNAYKQPGTISNKMGLRYYVNSHWAASVMVKAHWLAIADVVEWGIGYKL